MSRRKSTDKPPSDKGITNTPYGFRASIRIRGKLHQKHFRRSTDRIEGRKWLLKTEIKYRRGSPTSGRFDDDAARYLDTVTAMPTYQQRAQHIREWVAVFEHQKRDTITAAQITAQLHAWRAAGKSAASVNKRRSALMHLFTTLDGKAEPNPVKDTPKFQEPTPAPKALPYPWIARIFKAMVESKSKARLMVIAYTGIPHAQIQTIAAADVNFRARTVAVAGRQKGKGTGARIVPLTVDGVRAFKLMAKTQAWGSFSKSTLRVVFRRACKRALKREDFTPYDLRHSFGTEIYRSSGDIRATQILMAHSTPQLTHRYTLAAVDPRVAAAVQGFRRK